jgi:hypothetical protein
MPSISMVISSAQQLSPERVMDNTGLVNGLQPQTVGSVSLVSWAVTYWLSSSHIDGAAAVVTCWFFILKGRFDCCF